MIVALAGGVGGATLANGLARVLPPGDLTVIVNTGDDFEHLGLSISPDLDSVMYALAGINNRDLGWGRKSESWAFMDSLRALGGEDWFQLGDRDLATHVLRTHGMKRGRSLSEVTSELASRLGITQHIVPMSNDRIRSIVESDEGDLAFQEYFVRRRCEPRFRNIRFEGIENARGCSAALEGLDHAALEAIVFCPSNPVLSIAPILAVPGIADRLLARKVPAVAVSPFIGGKAVKGPAAKIMSEIGLQSDAAALFQWYKNLVDGLVIDRKDANEHHSGAVLATNTLMCDEADQMRLATDVRDFARSLKS